MNFLFCDDCSQLHLGKIITCLSLRISAEEKKKIEENRIFITNAVSPASVMSNVNIPCNGYDHSNCHLIHFNKDIVEFQGLSVDEQAAIILHEIGHILNNCTAEIVKVNKHNPDFYADDYVKRQGMKSSLVKALEKSLNNPLPWFEKATLELFAKRIERLNEKEAPELVGEIKTLRYSTKKKEK